MACDPAASGSTYCEFALDPRSTNGHASPYLDSATLSRRKAAEMPGGAIQHRPRSENQQWPNVGPLQWRLSGRAANPHSLAARSRLRIPIGRPAVRKLNDHRDDARSRATGPDDFLSTSGRRRTHRHAAAKKFGQRGGGSISISPIDTATRTRVRGVDTIHSARRPLDTDPRCPHRDALILGDVIASPREAAEPTPYGARVSSARDGRFGKPTRHENDLERSIVGWLGSGAD